MLPREHRPGDDMRRIHWRATARHGDLMVRREEQAWHSSLVVILDSRDRAHHGSGRDSTFEWAVSAAASIAIHHLRRGWRVTVLTADGRLLAEAAGSSAEGIEAVLEAFSDVSLGPEPMARTLMSAAEGASSVIAVIGRITEDAAETLLRPRSGFAGCLLLEPGPVDHLAARGWQVSTWTPSHPGGVRLGAVLPRRRGRLDRPGGIGGDRMGAGPWSAPGRLADTTVDGGGRAARDAVPDPAVRRLGWVMPAMASWCSSSPSSAQPVGPSRCPCRSSRWSRCSASWAS